MAQYVRIPQGNIKIFEIDLLLVDQALLNEVFQGFFGPSPCGFLCIKGEEERNRDIGCPYQNEGDPPAVFVGKEAGQNDSQHGAHRPCRVHPGSRSRTVLFTEVIRKHGI